MRPQPLPLPWRLPYALFWIAVGTLLSVAELLTTFAVVGNTIGSRGCGSSVRWSSWRRWRLGVQWLD